MVSSRERILGATNESSSSLELSAGAWIGGKYRLGVPLGHGGMGRVYEAEGPGGVRVALKMALAAERAQDPQTRSRFKLEAEAGQRIDSLHTVKILDHGEDPQHGPYLVMELLEGVDLGRFLGRQRLAAPTALRLFALVALGLDAAHQAGVLHRDVKPSNIFLHQQDGLVIPKLIDFGINDRLRSADDTRSTSTTRHQANLRHAATLAYASPEQALPEESKRRRLDHRSDLWGLTAVLYEALHGYRYCPFSNSDSLYQEAIEKRRWTRLFRPDSALPDEIFEVLETGLAYDPEARFPSAQAMSERLAALAQQPVTCSLTLLELQHALQEAVALPSREAYRLQIEPETSGAPAPEEVPLARGATATSPSQTATTAHENARRKPWSRVVFGLGGVGVLAGAAGLWASASPGAAGSVPATSTTPPEPSLASVPAPSASELPASEPSSMTSAPTAPLTASVVAGKPRTRTIRSAETRTTAPPTSAHPPPQTSSREKKRPHPATSFH